MPLSLRDPENEIPTGQRVRVFSLTWLSYATYYLARKNFSVVKARLQLEQGLTEKNLGDIDTGYLAAYALGQFLAGAAGDRIGARRLIGFGMISVGVASILFGAGSSAWIFGIAFAFNGLVQATGWPGNVKAMAGFFRKSERGTVMGIWTTNYQVGGLVATALATFILTHAGWRATFFIPSVLVAIVGAAILFFLPEPRLSTGAEKAAAKSTLRTRDLLRMPAFWSIGGAYFCLKLIRYSILFWLPFYLTKALHYSEEKSGYLSISFEVGGIIGAVVIGIVSDRYFPNRRRSISSTFVFALAGALLLYTVLAPLGPFANFVGMALIGFCLFGPDALISGAAAQDLGGPAAAATVAGAINGMGSIGAVLQGRVTSTISTAYGWNALYYVFVALALIAAVALRLGKPAPSAE
ncbi:MAG: MFS transporter [Myxococcaceae bacterium]